MKHRCADHRSVIQSVFHAVIKARGGRQTARRLAALCLTVLALGSVCLGMGAATAPEWTWMSGSNIQHQPAVDGTLYTPAAGNVPGARNGSVNWTDSVGNLWLFGGSGFGPGGTTRGWLNDLWEYNPSIQEWAWMGGGNAPGQPGAYGTLGVPASGNVPGSRAGAAGWTDSSGNLWLFGGYGYDSTGAQGLLNDLWEFSPATNEWTWMGGSSTVGANGGQPGVYGAYQVPSSTNIPGGRWWAASWTDQSGNFWLFGGDGFDVTGNYQGYLSDLWEFNPSTQQWAWMGGNDLVLCSGCGYQGAYGTLGAFGPLNQPGGRYAAASWVDSSGNLWLFGGLGFDSNRTLGYLNDLWEYNPSIHQWTWVGGSGTVPRTANDHGGQPGVYGTLGVFSAGNVPGGRYTPSTWVDANGNFWLFGGAGFDSAGTFNELNDLWEFNPATTQWAWMDGSSTVGASDTVPPVYGTQGVSAAGNTPGGRCAASSWTDANGNLWLFGGIGYDAADNMDDLNDLWYYQLSTTTLPAPPIFSVPAGIYGSALTVAISDATPGATIYYTTDGTTPTTASAVYNGAIAVNATETIEAIAAAGGQTNKGVAIAVYTILSPAAAPTFSPAPGGYLSPQSVTISDATPGAVIYYTTDGSIPTTASPAYNGAIAVSVTTTISAFAVAPGYANSLVTVATYTMGLPPPGNWVWMGGNNTTYGAGVYGNLGTATPGATPGSRYGAGSSTGNSGNFWLFGGQGEDAFGMGGFLNDLWEFSPSAQQWTWMNGGDQLNGATGFSGAYGTQGAAAPGNQPGSRWEALTWTDPSGNVWLFGGQGFDANGYEGYLNDLWQFTATTGEWTWISGSNTVPSNGFVGGQPGVYGNLQQPGSNNVPGGRLGAVGWTDSSGNLWLFGGNGWDSASNLGSLNDLWEFTPASGEWTWMGGSNTLPCNGCGQPGNYGLPGTPAAGNIPGGRYNATAWVDSAGNLWLFGGNGFDVNDYSGELDDLWEFSPSTLQWAWMGNGGLFNSEYNSNSGVYGVAGVASQNNLPGGRESANSWLDQSGNLWIFGGLGYDSQGNYGNLNDLWQYGFSTGQWTWMAGSSNLGNSNGLPGVYGTLGTPAAANTPGGRFGASSWSDTSGNLWIFGGDGIDGFGNYGFLNDAWEYQLTLPVVTVAAPTLSLPAGVYLPGQTVTISDSTPGAAIYYTTDGSAPTTASNVYSGPLTVNTTETIAAIAALIGSNSPVAIVTYTIELQAAPPVFSVASGSYDYSPMVTISDITPGATIYYTTDGSTPSPGNYIGASYSPVTVIVNATQTISAIAAAQGYFNSAVSTAAYTIPVNQPQAWAWMSGSSANGATGVYGKLGVPDSANVPGARSGLATWTDKQGNLWLFGGLGLDSTNAPADGTIYNGHLSDLWMFSPASGEWTWMGGSNLVAENGIWGQYGSQKPPSSGGYPGGRTSAAFATDSNGNLWLFGGEGYGSAGVYGMLNDLWEFNSTTQLWTWMSGSSTVPSGTYGQPGVYGAQGTPAASNIPGGRYMSVGWMDKSGNLWVFGGVGYDSAGELGSLNDLWEYSPSTQQWTWVSGGSALYGSTAYQGDYDFMSGAWGTMGVEAPGNVPSGRYDAGGWVDSAGNLWLFGGWGADSFNQVGALNDLWKFDISTRQWVWMSGGNTLLLGNVGLPGYYGALGVPGAANEPGGRRGAITWTDSSGNLWLHGGWGWDWIDFIGYLDDLWMFNVSSNEWIWMGGDEGLPNEVQDSAQPGVYGTEGIASVSNKPGGRQDAAGWVDSNGNLWLFGGGLMDPGGVWRVRNDLWEAPISGVTGPTQTPILIWATPASITYGTPLSGTQLNASANVAGTFAYSPAAGTVLAAGTQTLSVTFTPNDSADYTTATKSVSLAVLPATPSLSVTCTEVVYDGAAHACTASATGIDGVAVNGTAGFSPASEIAAGSYAVMATFTSGDPNYTGATAGGTLIIDPAASTATVTCNEVTYNGAPQNCTASVTPAGTCTGLVAYTDAGSYSETAICTPTDTNYAASSAGGTLTIDPVSQSPAVSCPGPLTYNGQAQSCTITGGFGTCTSGSVTNVPGGSVALSCTGDSNHAAWTGSGSIIINPAASTTTVSCSEVTYNGAPQNCTASVTPAGTCTGLVAYTNASSYSETAICTPTDTNYAASSAGGTLTIDPASQSPAVSCPGPLTYNGQAQSCTISGGFGTCTSGSVTNVPGGSVALSCMGDNNHTAWTGSGSITINPAAPALTVTCVAVTANGSPQACAPGGSASGIGGVAVTGSWSYTYNGSATAPAAAGSYTVVGTFSSGNSNYTGGTAAATLVINPAAPAVLAITPASLALTFGSQLVNTTSVAQYIELTNTGTTAVAVGPAAVSGPFAISNQAGTCTTSMNLAAGRTCVIRVVFSPTSGGAAGGAVVIDSAGAPGGSYTVALSGTGQAQSAVVTFSLTSVTFPNPQTVGTSSGAQYLQIASMGLASLEVTGVTLGGADPLDFLISNQAGTCTTGATLAYDAKCNLRIVFAPTAAGTRTATLYITDNAAGSPQAIPLSGTAISAGQLSLSTTALTFAAAAVGSETVAQYITLKSTGTAPVIVSSAVLGGADPGDFVLSNQAGTCTTGMTLAPGSGCNLRVNFKPQATGSRSATVIINDNTAGGPHVVTLSGTGE